MTFWVAARSITEPGRKPLAIVLGSAQVTDLLGPQRGSAQRESSWPTAEASRSASAASLLATLLVASRDEGSPTGVADHAFAGGLNDGTWIQLDRDDPRSPRAPESLGDGDAGRVPPGWRRVGRTPRPRHRQRAAGAGRAAERARALRGHHRVRQRHGGRHDRPSRPASTSRCSPPCSRSSCSRT